MQILRIFITFFTCFFLFVSSGYTLHAQEKDSLSIQKKLDRERKILNNIPSEDLPFDSIPKEIISSFSTRKQSYNFFKTLLELAEPSTASSKYFALDMTINSDSSLQKKMFKLNADIQTPIGVGGYKWNIRKLGWISTFQVVPQFKVRIFENDALRGDSSSPVRTPSYLPRLSYFGTHKSVWRVNPVSHYIGISVFHHSNGQDGYEFTDIGEINTYNGNFGENLNFEFLYGGMFSSKEKKRIRIKKGIKPDKLNKIFYSDKVVHDIYWKASLEWHPKSLTDSAFLAHDLYGKNRLNIQVGYINSPIYITKIYAGKDPKRWLTLTGPDQKEFFRVLLNINYILDRDYSIGNENSSVRVNYFNFEKRMNIYMTAYWRIIGTPYSAFFMQAGWWGSDNYNIYFQESLWHFRIGLSFGFFRYSGS